MRKLDDPPPQTFAGLFALDQVSTRFDLSVDKGERADDPGAESAGQTERCANQEERVRQRGGRGLADGAMAKGLPRL